MSTDFDGIAPTSDAGRHLNMNTQSLLPLTQFLEHIAPDAKDSFFDTWNYNSDEDWTNEEALQLASKIRENVENGHALRGPKPTAPR